MRRRALVVTALAAAIVATPGALRQRPIAHPITWADAAPIRDRLAARDITAASFPSRIDTLRATHARRVLEGDLDHLVFYLLQSTTFTKLLPIEPALSAKQYTDTGEVPANARARAAAFLHAVDAGGGDERLSYFRDLARATFPKGTKREAALLREYARVMKFVYEKEFVAQRSGQRDAAIAELYRTRGLSTDTAVEAGFLVSEGLAVARALDAGLRIRRVLIVGPGLDLAPRTGLLEASAPESYQPWAVVDALLALGLSRIDDLTVVGADINPRVVRHLLRASGKTRTLTLVSGIAESDSITLSTAFRDYFEQLGRHLNGPGFRGETASAERSEQEARGGGAPRALGEGRSEAASAKRGRERSERKAPGGGAPGAPSDADRATDHLSKTIRVDAVVARVLHAEPLDIVTERLAPASFDLVVATNIFPYFDDVELALALANIGSMLAPGGLLLHNEHRPVIEELTAAVGLPLEQSRHEIIASVRGGPPLADSVFLHRCTGVRGSALGARQVR